MLRGRSSLWYTNDMFMRSQLPGMSVATCSNPTRDLLWWWPSPHPYGATCTTHDYGPYHMIYVLTMKPRFKNWKEFCYVFMLARCFACERFRNDFWKAIIYSVYTGICISLSMHVLFLNCFQNSLCEARMRWSEVFSLTGFNPLLFLCLWWIVFFRYTALASATSSWFLVRCPLINDALLFGSLCYDVRALHQVYVGYGCIWKSNIYLILSCFSL